jgi:filamentous hemagglutinin family protein
MKSMSSSARGGSTGRGSLRLHQFGINLIVATFAAGSCGAYAIGISAGGGTVTTVSATANRQPTVDIVPTIAWAWSNAFRSLNVDAAGPLLNDIGLRIQTIVRQLESGNRRIVGRRINVTGSQANTILVDPCGIPVNGGSFKDVSYDVFIGGPLYQPTRFPNRWPVAGFSVSFLL